MASSVGVVFYWIRFGNHPEVAKGTRGKLPILDGGITVGSAIEQIATNPEHIISQSRYQISVYDEVTQRHLSNLSELLTNYSRIYLKVELRTLDSVEDQPNVDREDEIVEKNANETSWENGIFADAKWRGGSYVQTGPSAAKILVITSNCGFPLNLPRYASSTGASPCPFCRSDRAAPPTVHLDCCGYTCCSECLEYITASHLFSKGGVCAVCGSTQHDENPQGNLVKRESDFEVRAPCDSLASGVDMAESRQRSGSLCSSDGCFGCDSVLLI